MREAMGGILRGDMYDPQNSHLARSVGKPYAGDQVEG
jgi:hypothetical protein